MCALTLIGATSGTRSDRTTNNGHIRIRTAWLAGWLAGVVQNRSSRSTTTDCFFPPFLIVSSLSFLYIHHHLSETIFPFSPSFCARAHSLSSPTLSLSLSPLPLMPSNRRRSAQKQFILFISSSFLRRHKDEDGDADDVDFFIRRSPPHSITNENERTHLDAMLFEKIILSADHPIPNSSFQSTRTKENRAVMTTVRRQLLICPAPRLCPCA